MFRHTRVIIRLISLKGNNRYTVINKQNEININIYNKTETASISQELCVLHRVRNTTWAPFSLLCSSVCHMNWIWFNLELKIRNKTDLLEPVMVTRRWHRTSLSV